MKITLLGVFALWNAWAATVDEVRIQYTRYNNTIADKDPNVCPQEIIDLIEGKAFWLTYYTNYKMAWLKDSNTSGVSVEEVELANAGVRGYYDFIAVEETTMEINDETYPIDQASLKAKIYPALDWTSSFYTGSGKVNGCLVLGEGERTPSP